MGGGGGGGYFFQEYYHPIPGVTNILKFGIPPVPQQLPKSRSRLIQLSPASTSDKQLAWIPTVVEDR